MSLSESPKFDQEAENASLEDKRPAEPTPESKPPSGRPHWTRIAIAALALAIIIMGALYVVGHTGGGTSETRTGSVTIHGLVVDPQGLPIPNAVVYVEGMEVEVSTDARGSFTIEKAPAGKLIVVVGVTPEAPQFLVVTVGADNFSDVGRIVYQPRTH